MQPMAEPGKAPGRIYLEAMLEGRAAPPPYARVLNMQLVEVGDGSAVFSMPVTEDLYNPNDVVHGGALTSLLDSAMGLAVISTLQEGETFTTVELKVNFLKAVTVASGPLRANGQVVQRGRQVIVAEADGFDRDGQRVAKATSTNLLVAERPVPVRPPEAAAPVAVPVPSPVTPPYSPPPSPLEHPPPARLPSVEPPIPPAPLAQGKQYVRLFSGNIGYLRRGQGLPIVLLHGIPSSSFLWRDVIDPLSSHFDVIAPDLLGYGDSEKRVDANLSVAAQARYVVAFLEALQVREAAFVGHDVGGGIAQLIATDEPARVARLILIDSIADNNWPIPDIARLKEPAWDQIMTTLDLREGFRKGLEAGMTTPGRVTDELVAEWSRPFQDLDGRRAYLRAARALNNRDLVSRRRHIEEITAPTLILWGAQDRFLEPRWAEYLHERIPHAAVQIIDPGGHFLPLDRPDAVVDALLQFLLGR
jgi:uncharacterized protein (TIGR00369 family)